VEPETPLNEAKPPCETAMDAKAFHAVIFGDSTRIEDHSAIGFSFPSNDDASWSCLKKKDILAKGPQIKPWGYLPSIRYSTHC
jgi:hypothetical protein